MNGKTFNSSPRKKSLKREKFVTIYWLTVFRLDRFGLQRFSERERWREFVMHLSQFAHTQYSVRLFVRLEKLLLWNSQAFKVITTGHSTMWPIHRKIDSAESIV